MILSKSIVGGALATLCMDVGGALGRATGLIAGTPKPILGKRFTYLLQGRLIHADIVASPEVPLRMPVVTAIHYGIGIVLAGCFTALCSWQPPDREEQFPLAASFGVFTVLLAWFLMFPAMGWGIAGTRGPAQLLLTRSTLVYHAFYGLGLGLWTAVLAPLLMR